MSNKEHDDAPEISGYVILQRFLLLVGLLIALAYLGYWMYEKHLWNILQQSYVAVKEFWLTFTLAGLWRGLVVWVSKMSYKWILVEVPKQLFRYTVLPYVLIYLTPLKYRSKIKKFFQSLLMGVLKIKDHTQQKMQYYFGDKISFGFALVLGIALLILFNVLFGVYLVIWLGLIKFPAVIVHFTVAFRRWVMSKVQIGSFGKFMFKWTGFIQESMWALLARISPKLTRRFRKNRTEEEEKQMRLNRMRRMIRARIRHREQRKLFFAVRGNMTEYRKLRRLQIRQRKVMMPDLSKPVELPCCSSHCK